MKVINQIWMIPATQIFHPQHPVELNFFFLILAISYHRKSEQPSSLFIIIRTGITGRTIVVGKHLLFILMVLQCQEQKNLGSVTGNDPISNPGEIFIDPLSAFPKHFKGLEILINESYWYNPIYEQIYDDVFKTFDKEH